MRAPARLGLITSIVAKDLREFSRDKLWMAMTPAFLLIVIVIFRLLPDVMHEEIRLGLYPPEAAEILGPLVNGTAGGRIQIRPFSSQDEMEDEVLHSRGDLTAGIALPSGFTSDFLRQSTMTINLYLPGSLPPGMGRAIRSGITEAGYASRAVLSGLDPLDQLPVRIEDPSELLAMQDGAIVSIADKLRPLLILVVLMMESLALAGLVSIEIENRTASAVLVTPVSSREFLAAKSLTGLLLAVSQGFVFLMATGSFSFDWGLMTILILIGAGMASAVGMISGSGGRDFMGTMFFGLMFLIPLMMPAVSSMIPGRAPLLIRFIPSYGLVVTLGGVLQGTMGWSSIAPYVGTLAAWDAAMMITAFILLRRRIRSL